MEPTSDIAQAHGAGEQALLGSFDVMAELEVRSAKMIGDKPLTAILRGLSAFIAQAEKG